MTTTHPDPDPAPAAPALVIEVAPRIFCLDVEYLGSPRAIASCVLRTMAGVVVVDPGPTTTLPALERRLAEAGTSLDDVDALLLTHIHLDHAGATGTLVRRYPRLRVYVHERGAPHLADPSRLLQSAERLYGAEMDRLFGEFAPVPAEQLHALVGGEDIVVGGRTLSVAYVPGHAWHHVAYLDQATGVAFVGDTAGERFPGATYVMPVTPPPDIDLERWAESLWALRQWRPRQLFLTHFGAYDDPERHLAELEERVGQWSSSVRESLAADASDEERAARFEQDALDDIERHVPAPLAGPYAGGSPRSSWYGLARYWRKRLSA